MRDSHRQVIHTIPKSEQAFRSNSSGWSLPRLGPNLSSPIGSAFGLTLKARPEAKEETGWGWGVGGPWDFKEGLLFSLYCPNLGFLLLLLLLPLLHPMRPPGQGRGGWGEGCRVLPNPSSTKAWIQKKLLSNPGPRLLLLARAVTWHGSIVRDKYEVLGCVKETLYMHSHKCVSVCVCMPACEYIHIHIIQIMHRYRVLKCVGCHRC